MQPDTAGDHRGAVDGPGLATLVVDKIRGTVEPSSRRRGRRCIWRGEEG